MPTRVDLFTRHTCLRGLQTTRRLEIAEQQAVVTQKQRVVVPAGAPQRFEHFRPNRLVVRFVLGQHVRAHFEQKSDSWHNLSIPLLQNLRDTLQGLFAAVLFFFLFVVCRSARPGRPTNDEHLKREYLAAAG